MVLLSSPSCCALRCMTRRVAAASSMKLASGPQPSSSSASIKNLMAVRSTTLRAIGSFSSTSSDVTSLTCGLSRPNLRKNNNADDNRWTTATTRPFSSPAAPKNNNAQPLGEPITFLTLNTLADNPGAVRKARRIGRGIGSSKGKTSGRGHKGQKSRAGRGVHPTFEGGQTRFYQRIPKIDNMKNARFKLILVPLNVGKVQDYVTMGRLVPERSDGVITMRDFVRAGMFPNSSIKSGVKLLGDGKERLKDKLLIEVPWASATAIEAIESKGGFVTTVHYNRLALRALLKPHKFPPKPEVMLAAERAAEGDEGPVDVHDMHLLPRRARPPPKYMPYYTDYAKRGYLNPKVQLERKKRGLKDILLNY